MIKGFLVFIGQSSINPPRTAYTPLPATRPARSYPRSESRRVKTNGERIKSVSIKNAFSLHHAWVFTAFFMARAFSENHKAPRSRFWGVTETIKSSAISGSAGATILSFYAIMLVIKFQAPNIKSQTNLNDQNSNVQNRFEFVYWNL